MSLVLLIGGGLLARSFNELQRVDPGFDADGLLTFRIELSGEDYRDGAARTEFYDRLIQRLTALTSVDAVGATSALPFSGIVSWSPVRLVDYVPPQGAGHEIHAESRFVSPEYFSTMNIPVIRGRSFDATDQADAQQVAIIDEHFAETYFPDRDPIGKDLEDWGGSHTIVGVVGTIKHESFDKNSRVMVYEPVSQTRGWGLSVVAHTEGDPITLIDPVTRIVQELNSDLPIVDVTPMSGLLASSMDGRRFTMVLIRVLGAVALILAAIGIYGLVAYRVNEGTRELGLRVALGAPTKAILTLVLGHGLALAAAGIFFGLAAAFVFTAFLRSMLFGVSALDPLTFAVVSAGLVVTTLIACYIPARRATRLDPLVAFRES
jgi:putative ABC transport system permease protein